MVETYLEWFLGKGNLDNEAVVVEVCKFMGWDYYTYLRQPQFFLNTILARMEAEGKATHYFQMKQK
jgi:hypothetical protein